MVLNSVSLLKSDYSVCFFVGIAWEGKQPLLEPGKARKRRTAHRINRKKFLRTEIKTHEKNDIARKTVRKIETNYAKQQQHYSSVTTSSCITVSLTRKYVIKMSFGLTQRRLLIYGERRRLREFFWKIPPQNHFQFILFFAFTCHQFDVLNVLELSRAEKENWNGISNMAMYFQTNQMIQSHAMTLM